MPHFEFAYYDKCTREFLLKTEDYSIRNLLFGTTGMTPMVYKKPWEEPDLGLRFPEIAWDELQLKLKRFCIPDIMNYNCSNGVTSFPLLSNSVGEDIRIDAYQWEAACWLTQTGRVLGDEQGLGKTVCTLLAYEHLRRAGRVYKLLVLCPKRAIRTWRDEYKKHLGREPEDTTYFINYDKLLMEKDLKEIHSFLNSVPEEQVFLHFDEIHQIGYASKKYNVLDSLLINKKYHITATTGTFVRNKTDSFYAPYVLVTRANCEYKDFMRKHFSPISRQGMNLEALEVVFKHFTLRRTKEQVKLKIQRKTLTPIYVPITGKHKEEYSKAKRGYYALQRTYLTGKVSSNFGELSRLISTVDHPAISLDKSFPDGECNKLEIIQDLIEEADGKPLVVWSKHPIILQKIANRNAFLNPVLLIGGLTEKEFNKRLDKFIKDPTCKLALLSLGACNQALDGLQYKCSTAIFHDISWKVTEFIQSQDRLHRRGQSSIVNLYYLLYENTIDEYIFRLVQNKIKEQDKITGEYYTKDYDIFGSLTVEELLQNI